MRGDPPETVYDALAYLESTPHARGSTSRLIAFLRACQVYPACAGIHLCSDDLFLSYRRLPRMRGDPPSARIHLAPKIRSTPHARGSTFMGSPDSWVPLVYPACAGIHPFTKLGEIGVKGLPRMRGDPPCHLVTNAVPLQSTPHARGSTPIMIHHECISRVYPACAGIHPWKILTI